MTTPAPPPFSYEEALAAVLAANAATTPAGVAVSVAGQLAEGVIAARERAADWARRIITALWNPVDPYDGAQVAAFTTAAVEHMATAQTAVTRAVAGAQKQSLATMGVVVPARVTNPVDVRGARVLTVDGAVVVDRSAAPSRVEYANDDVAKVSSDDMTTEAVLNRPARAFRYAESQGADRDAASLAAIERLDVIIEDNLMLAQRLAESEMLANAVNLDVDTSPIVGYRRIIHPELSRTGVCGLCLAASDRLYTIGELRPIHDRCKCTTSAVTMDFDPAETINKVDLQQLYDAAGGTSGAHLKRTRYKEDEHGELGPVLVPEREYTPRSAKGQQQSSAVVTGASESKSDVARRQLPLFEANLAKLWEQGLDAESSPIKYHMQQIARYRETIAADQGSSRSTSRSASSRTKKRMEDQNAPKSATGSSGGGKPPTTKPPVSAAAAGDDRERWNQSAAAALSKHLRASPGDIANAREDVLTDASYVLNRAFPDEALRDTYVQAIRDGMTQLLDHEDARVVVRTSHFGEVVNSGRFMSQFETGTSGGVVDREGRALWEVARFGTPSADNPPRVFGSVEVPGMRETVGEIYRSGGGASVYLKPEALQRSTVTVGDSYRLRDQVMPADPRLPGEDNQYFARPQDFDYVNLAGDREANADAMFQAFVDYPRDESRPYIEAQVAGGVTLADIERVVLYEAPSADLTAKLDAEGIQWEVRR